MFIDLFSNSVKFKRLLLKIDKRLVSEIIISIVLLEKSWNEKSIEFELELDKVKYYGEEDLLQQVWLNLINNAIKFSMINGKIKILLKNENAKNIVEISDNGIGIPESDINKIFEKFYKVDKSRTKNGNGLGLSIVKKIIDTIGGDINVKSKLGKGTTFIIKF